MNLKLAVAGHGKSTEIKNTAKAGDAVIGNTRGATDRLTELLAGSGIYVDTIEGANVRAKDINNIFIDEIN